MGWTIPNKKSLSGGINSFASIGTTKASSKLPRYDRYRASRGTFSDSKDHAYVSSGNTSFSSFGNTDKKMFSDAKKRKFLSTEELKEKVHVVAPKSSAANYMLPKNVSSDMVIIGQQSAHALTLVTREHFRSYIRLILRFLRGPKLQKKKSIFIRRVTDFIWRHSCYHKELLEQVHIIDFLNGIGITNTSLPRDHDRFGDQYAELLNRLSIVSLELVHSIPLTRHRKPGSSSYSWVTELDSVDQGLVTNNLNLFKDITYKDRRKTTASLLSVQISTDVVSPVEEKERATGKGSAEVLPPGKKNDVGKGSTEVLPPDKKKIVKEKRR